MKQRQSNIELLRILAMLMIIDVHYFASCDAAIHTIRFSGNWYVHQIVQSFGICGVNIFILITGFFSLQQREVKFRKMIDLLVDVAFFGGFGFLLCILVGWKSFDGKALIKTMFPILFGTRWFVKAYLVLLCLIPFLNLVLNSIRKSSYQKLLILLTLLFSVWPSFLPHPPIDDYGYGFFHFVYLYCVAGYIRLHVEKYPHKWLCLACFFLSAVLVCAFSMHGHGYAWAYDFVFVVTEAVSLFLFFAQLKLQAVWINRLASCAFGVFLIHTDGFFSVLIYDKLLHCSDLVTGNPWMFLLSALVSLPLFYLIGFALESLKKALFSVSVSPLLDRVPLLKRPFLIERKDENEKTPDRTV